jgi:hypothetical protein
MLNNFTNSMSLEGGRGSVAPCCSCHWSHAACRSYKIEKTEASHFRTSPIEGGRGRGGGGHLAVTVVESCLQSDLVKDGVDSACMSYKMKNTEGVRLEVQQRGKVGGVARLLTGE